jgi:hypothetical protein
MIQSKEKLFSSLFAFTIILSIQPYFVWYDYPYLFRIFAFGIFILFFINRLISKKDFYLNKNLLLIYLYVLIVFCLLSFSNNGINIAISNSIMLIIIYLLVETNIKRDIFFKFVKIYAMFLILPILNYVLLANGLDLEWSRLETNNELKSINGVYYREYIGMVILSSQIFQIGNGMFFRLSGVFDEPGVIGTLSVLILVALRFDLKKWYGIIIFIGGLLSFSLVFYIVSFIYVIVYKIKYIVILPFIIILAIYAIENNNELVNKYLVNRVTLLFTDIDSVDNRVSACFESKYKDFLSSESIYFGRGKDAQIDTGCDVSSWKMVVYNHGIVGFMLIIGIYILIILHILKTEKNLNKKVLILTCLAFALSFYQRPHFSALYFLILFYSASMQYKIENFRNRNKYIHKIQKKSEFYNVDYRKTIQ